MGPVQARASFSCHGLDKNFVHEAVGFLRAEKCYAPDNKLS